MMALMAVMGSNMLEVIILAADQGVQSSTPKVLHPLAGRPLVACGADCTRLNATGLRGGLRRGDASAVGG